MPALPIDDENLPLFTVGQVAATLDIQHAFLRRLDEFGVVRPSRSAGGQRRYTRAEVTVVQYVVRLVEDGMTLAAIRRILELEDQVRRLVAQRDALVAELAGLRAELGRGNADPGRDRAFGRTTGLTGTARDDAGQP